MSMSILPRPTEYVQDLRLIQISDKLAYRDHVPALNTREMNLCGAGIIR